MKDLSSESYENVIRTNTPEDYLASIMAAAIRQQNGEPEIEETYEYEEPELGITIIQGLPINDNKQQEIVTYIDKKIIKVDIDNYSISLSKNLSSEIYNAIKSIEKYAKLDNKFSIYQTKGIDYIKHIIQRSLVIGYKLGIRDKETQKELIATIVSQNIGLAPSMSLSKNADNTAEMIMKLYDKYIENDLDPAQTALITLMLPMLGHNHTNLDSPAQWYSNIEKLQEIVDKLQSEEMSYIVDDLKSLFTTNGLMIKPEYIDEFNKMKSIACTALLSNILKNYYDNTNYQGYKMTIKDNVKISKDSILNNIFIGSYKETETLYIDITDTNNSKIGSYFSGEIDLSIAELVGNNNVECDLEITPDDNVMITFNVKDLNKCPQSTVMAIYKKILGIPRIHLYKKNEIETKIFVIIKDESNVKAFDKDKFWNEKIKEIKDLLGKKEDDPATEDNPFEWKYHMKIKYYKEVE